MPQHRADSTSADDGDTLIKDAAEFVRVMNIDKPVLMGHSMGAATVMRVGAEYPDLAQAVIMLDPGLPRADGAPETLVAQNNYDYDELVELCLDFRHPEWGEIGCQYWALSEKQYHGPYSDEMFAVMSGSMRIGDSLANIPVPSLILKADTSPEGRRANAEAVREMPRVTLVHIDGAGHNIHLDEPERAVNAVKEFLATP